jgi:hypothetical protein
VVPGRHAGSAALALVQLGKSRVPLWISRRKLDSEKNLFNTEELHFKTQGNLEVARVYLTRATSRNALTKRLIIVSMNFLFNGARVFLPAAFYLWRVRKPALRYFGTLYYFETISN